MSSVPSTSATRGADGAPSTSASTKTTTESNVDGVGAVDPDVKARSSATRTTTESEIDAVKTGKMSASSSAKTRDEDDRVGAEDVDDEEDGGNVGDAGGDDDGGDDDNYEDKEEEEGNDDDDDDDDDTRASNTAHVGAANCEGDDCSDSLNEQVYAVMEDVATKTALDTQTSVDDILALATGTSDQSPRTMQEEAMDERVAAFSMTVMICILLLTIVLGVVLKHYKSKWLHSSGAALLLGIAVGCFVFLTLEASYDTMPANMRYGIKAFASSMRFDTKFFFLVLLPPLVFEAGYTLHPTTFFNNADAVSMFAFVGSLSSAITTGVMMYVAGLTGLSYKFSLKSAMLFGALISSTDPVTTLSIFSSTPVSQDLHAIIMGESIMNDAITIVLFESLLLGASATDTMTVVDMLQQDASFLPLILEAIGTFMLAFSQATLVGVGIGCFSALLHKYVRTTNDFEEGWVVDSALVLLLPYLSYSLAESFELSGIVAVLFTGIVMGRYTRPNLARAPRMVTMCVFKIFSFLSETFVFVYMGSAMYSFRSAHIVTAIVGLLVTYISRAANIFPGSFLLNVTSARKNPAHSITPRMQIILWFSGLRGAVAFALAEKARRDLGEQGHVMFDVTLFIVAFTIVIQGGMTTWLLNKLSEPATTTSDPSNPEKRVLSNISRLISSVETNIIEPILSRTPAVNSSERTSLLHGDYAGGREEAAEPPLSGHSVGLASESVEAAVDGTFTQRGDL